MCASTRAGFHFVATKKKNQSVAELYNENDVGGRVIQVSPPITILSLASNCKLELYDQSRRENYHADL